MDKKITIDKNKCISCGLCIRECFVSCLTYDEEKYPKYAEGMTDNCVCCQHCLAICPVGALTFADKNPDDSASVSYADENELLNLIKSRRSIREYKDEDLSDETIQKLGNMLSYVPTGGNSPTLHFTIIGSKDKMEEIKTITYEKIASESDNPIYQFVLDSYENGAEMVYRGAPSMIIASVDKSIAAPGCETVDPIIALSYLELYAYSLGLGALWCDLAYTIIKDNDDLKTLLEIPEEYTVSFVLLLGKPAANYKRTIQPDPVKFNVLK